LPLIENKDRQPGNRGREAEFPDCLSIVAWQGVEKLWYAALLRIFDWIKARTRVFQHPASLPWRTWRA
jgi:hypothetical protein